MDGRGFAIRHMKNRREAMPRYLEAVLKDRGTWARRLFGKDGSGADTLWDECDEAIRQSECERGENLSICFTIPADFKH